MGQMIEKSVLIEALKQTDMRFIAVNVLTDMLIPTLPTVRDAIPRKWIEEYRERHIGQWKAISIDEMLAEWSETHGKV